MQWQLLPDVGQVIAVSGAGAAMAPPAGTGRSRDVRRAPFVIAWWTRRGARLFNYASGRTYDTGSLALAAFEHAGAWISVADLVLELGADATRVKDAIDELIAHDMLLTRDRGHLPAERALSAWSGWNPAAGFFHRATRVNEWPPVGPGSGPPVVCRQDATVPGRHRPGTRLELPPFAGGGPLEKALLARRTWRRFGTAPVTLDQLSTLLGLTFGVQQWIDIDGERVPLRTSPSGGARNSIEAYVLARRIDDLDPGTFHYCPDSHALLPLEVGAPPDGLFPAGSGFDDAAAIVFATSVFGRVQRKYDSPRAYRVVLLEAGHFAQTFCVLATSLGLAPFCTAAFADDAVDRLLHVDGVSEATLYAMGVGNRPHDSTWAPWPFDAPVPRPTAPGYAARFAPGDWVPSTGPGDVP